MSSGGGILWCTTSFWIYQQRHNSNSSILRSISDKGSSSCNSHSTPVCDIQQAAGVSISTQYSSTTPEQADTRREHENYAQFPYYILGTSLNPLVLLYACFPRSTMNLHQLTKQIRHGGWHITFPDHVPTCSTPIWRWTRILMRWSTSFLKNQIIRRTHREGSKFTRALG